MNSYIVCGCVQIWYITIQYIEWLIVVYGYLIYTPDRFISPYQRSICQFKHIYSKRYISINQFRKILSKYHKKWLSSSLYIVDLNLSFPLRRKCNLRRHDSNRQLWFLEKLSDADSLLNMILFLMVLCDLKCCIEILLRKFSKVI